mmetsp:Transcript_29537/g.81156  ORF Transcript_29537/g.81156 Transcript_29537/m.81156 type:complete len:273 (-) Transcript_29537:87-905(-)
MGTMSSSSPWKKCTHGRPSNLSGNVEATKVLSMSTPPTLQELPTVAARATAPPWEKPASTIRSGATPASSCRCTSPHTYSALSARPGGFILKSSKSNVLMSNQLGMEAPMFTVTGCVGAVGKRNRVRGSRPRSCGPATSVQPRPVSPRPWSQITVESWPSGSLVPKRSPKDAAAHVSFLRGREGLLGSGELAASPCDCEGGPQGREMPHGSTARPTPRAARARAGAREPQPPPAPRATAARDAAPQAAAAAARKAPAALAGPPCCWRRQCMA